jgi:hypothetical protein
MHCYVNTMLPWNPEITTISKKSSPRRCLLNPLRSRTWMTPPNAVKLETHLSQCHDYINSLGRAKKNEMFLFAQSVSLLSVSGFGKEMW